MSRVIDKPPTHSWIIPLYQDELNIQTIVTRSVEYLEQLTADFELILVNDGSTDGTAALALKLAAEYSRLVVIHHDKNRGYGAALASGFAKARGVQFIGYTDGDAQYDPCDLLPAPLLHNPQKPQALLGYKRQRGDGLYRRFQSGIYNELLRKSFGLRVKDANCSLKWFPAEALKKLVIKSSSAFIDAEILLKLQKLQVEFVEVPVHHYGRGVLSQKLSANGSDPPVHAKGAGAKAKIIFATLRDLTQYFLEVRI